MAYLGDLTIGKGYPQKEIVIVNMVINGIRDIMWINKTTKSLSGHVTLNTQPTQRDVRVHHRVSGLPVSTVRTDINGLFSVPGVSSDEYYIVALPFDDDGANAVVIDRVQGV